MIYFIQAGNNGPIKIGIASKPETRLKNLQTAHFDELTIRGVMPGDKEVEKELHDRFSSYHMRGEWFQNAKEIDEFILTNCSLGTVNKIQRLYNGEYMLTFAMPLKATRKLLLLSGSYRIELISDRLHGEIFGVKGDAQTMLEWLQSLSLEEKALEEFTTALLDSPETRKS